MVSPFAELLVVEMTNRFVDVVGAPDPERGTIVKAFVVLKTGNDRGDEMKKQLQDHVKRAIAPYKYPRAIEFIDALPRTETGKVQRFKLRTLEGK